MNRFRAIRWPQLDMVVLAVLALTLATAAIHASRALADPHIAVLFALNAIGYVTLLGLLYLPLPLPTKARTGVRWVLVGYAALTFLLYFVWGMMKGEWLVPIGPADKVIEAFLIAILVWQSRLARPAQSQNA